MSRIVVTGAAGKLGRAVVRDLVEHGDEVVAVDVRAPADDNAPFVRTDLTEYGQVVEALGHVDGRVPAPVDAVVHLAAIPAPGLATNSATFRNNMLSTYNVFAAAKQLGIRRVVWASSETVLGLPFDTPPPYLPVDEEYAARPESTYSLVKHLEETMAAEFARWDAGSTWIGLRFSNVMDPEDYVHFPSYDEDIQARRWNLWGYIDARDGAQAVRRALGWDGTGCEVFVIANADTVMSRESAALAADVFPGVPVSRDLGANETLLSIDKARRLLGYEPEHSWRRQR
ncbi:MAG: NAD-dependent epimerase/dehydratase [Frankiales bacterium]|nr:NAD-dependent epimerase/dehydratase [Frankiales bacterium]